MGVSVLSSILIASVLFCYYDYFGSFWCWFERMWRGWRAVGGAMGLDKGLH